MNLVHLACLACLAAAESEGQINPTPRPVLRETVAAWDFAKGRAMDCRGPMRGRFV